MSDQKKNTSDQFGTQVSMKRLATDALNDEKRRQLLNSQVFHPSTYCRGNEDNYLFAFGAEL